MRLLKSLQVTCFEILFRKQSLYTGLTEHQLRLSSVQKLYLAFCRIVLCMCTSLSKDTALIGNINKELRDFFMISADFQKLSLLLFSLGLQLAFKSRYTTCSTICYEQRNTHSVFLLTASQSSQQRSSNTRQLRIIVKVMTKFSYNNVKKVVLCHRSTVFVQVLIRKVYGWRWYEFLNCWPVYDSRATDKNFSRSYPSGFLIVTPWKILNMYRQNA